MTGNAAQDWTPSSETTGPNTGPCEVKGVGEITNNLLDVPKWIKNSNLTWKNDVLSGNTTTIFDAFEISLDAFKGKTLTIKAKVTLSGSSKV